MRNIRPKTVDFRTLKLSPEEGFVLSRVDGATEVKDLVALTGLDEGRVREIVGRLADEGALDVERDGAPEAPAAGGGAFGDVGFDDEPSETPEDVGEAADSVGTEASDADDPATSGVVLEERRNERAYRQIYETTYRPMEKDRRIKEAGELGGNDLMALCLDPDPQVIHAIIGNPHGGIDHSRMIALHHRTQMGLEAIAKRAEHLKDSLVQRRMLRNPQLPNSILGRMVNPKMMLEIYKVAIDREIPERSRLLTRDILRKKFMVAGSDEKASLIFKTEGRCLQHLTNCSLDAHATQILCGKTMYTNMFVQNFSRWSATPPPLLSHLVKLPIVRNNIGLRKMLLKHPNMPSEARRQG